MNYAAYGVCAPKPYLDQSGYLPHFQPTHLQPFIIIWYGKVVGVVEGVVGTRVVEVVYGGAGDIVAS